MKYLFIFILLCVTTVALSGCRTAIVCIDGDCLFYGCIGPQSVTVDKDGIKQESDGTVPSGLFTLLAELFK